MLTCQIGMLATVFGGDDDGCNGGCGVSDCQYKCANGAVRVPVVSWLSVGGPLFVYNK